MRRRPLITAVRLAARAWAVVHVERDAYRLGRRLTMLRGAMMFEEQVAGFSLHVFDKGATVDVHASTPVDGLDDEYRYGWGFGGSLTGAVAAADMAVIRLADDLANPPHRLGDHFSPPVSTDEPRS